MFSLYLFSPVRVSLLAQIARLVNVDSSSSQKQKRHRIGETEMVVLFPEIINMIFSRTRRAHLGQAKVEAKLSLGVNRPSGLSMVSWRIGFQKVMENLTHATLRSLHNLEFQKQNGHYQ